MAANDVRTGGGAHRPTMSLLYNPAFRSILFQIVTVVVVFGAIYYAATNVVANLARSGMSSGFGFLNSRAGFDIGQQLIAYSPDSTYFSALLVGLLNTLLIAFWGILLGLVLALFLWRKAVIAPGAHGAVLMAAAVAAAVVPFLVSIVLADRVVRRFSRGCLGRPPGPADIRVARSSDARKQLLGFGQRG